jgi:DNA-3-methyladenine glycosylase II
VEVRQFEIEVAPPFRLDLTVWALRRRQHNVVDLWDGTCYQRILMVQERPVEVNVRQHHGSTLPVLGVELRGAGSALDDDGAAEVRSALERILGLKVDLGGFYRMAERDERLRTLARRFSGMRPPCFPSVFEAVINAIACQQLSLVVGIHLLNRLAQSLGSTRSDGGTQPSFPTAERLAEVNPQALRDLGFSWAKTRALGSLAGQVASGKLDLEALWNEADERALSVLLDLTGVGRWSAEYTLLRGLGRWHVLPGDDVGARNNLRRRFDLPSTAGYDAVAELARAWWPYGGLVYFHLLLDALATAGHVTPSLSSTDKSRRGAPRRMGRVRDVVS